MVRNSFDTKREKVEGKWPDSLHLKDRAEYEATYEIPVFVNGGYDSDLVSSATGEDEEPPALTTGGCVGIVGVGEDAYFAAVSSPDLEYYGSDFRRGPVEDFLKGMDDDVEEEIQEVEAFTGGYGRADDLIDVIAAVEAFTDIDNVGAVQVETPESDFYQRISQTERDSSILHNQRLGVRSLMYNEETGYEIGIPEGFDDESIV